jgi:hypothetical protein
VFSEYAPLHTKEIHDSPEEQQSHLKDKELDRVKESPPQNYASLDREDSSFSTFISETEAREAQRRYTTDEDRYVSYNFSIEYGSLFYQ